MTQAGDGVPLEPQGPKIKFGPAVQKLRKAVAAKLLSISLEELEMLDFNRMNLVQMLNLSKFKHSLINLFEENKGFVAKFQIYNNIGRRYELVAKNVFYNEYLIDFVRKMPRFGEYFRIKTLEFLKGPKRWDGLDEPAQYAEEKFKQLEKIFDSSWEKTTSSGSQKTKS